MADIDHIEPDLKIEIVRTCVDRSYVSCLGERIRLVIGHFVQHAMQQQRRRFAGAILIVADKDGERQAVECFSQPDLLRQARLRGSRLSDLARSRVTSDEFYEALYEMAEIAIPLEEGGDHYSADNEEESPKHTRFDDVRARF
jgi:hypothetical protein